MSHIALYRKYRPQSFKDVVGQQPIIQTLQNSLNDGRITHAYLFSGPRGTGKTSAAKLLAKAVNCEQGPAAEPCNECDACKRITDGSVMDVVEIDAASNRGVEEIRDLREKVKYAPTEVRRKVYIIDEVHMLTTEAFNALLKTLEEPPPHVMFILATTEPHKLPATIISRCQRFDFRRVQLEDQVSRLQYICEQEEIAAEVAALQYIARLSDGAMRDALSLLDQISSYSGELITYDHVVAMTGGMASEQFKEIAEAIYRQDVGRVLDLANALILEGKSADKCMENLIHYFRDLIMIKLIPQSQVVTERIVDAQMFAETADQIDAHQAFAIIDVLNHYHVEMKYTSQPKTLFEVAMIKICLAMPGGNEIAAAAQVQLDPQHSARTPGLAAAVTGLPFQPQSKTAMAPQPQSGAAMTEFSAQLPQLNGEVLAGLEAKIAALEKQISQLTASAESFSSAKPAPRSAPSSPFLRKSPLGGPSLKKSSELLEGYVAGQDSESFRQVKTKWHNVLEQMRQRKVTVHAWLINGEPVSVEHDVVLLAFKNTMHKETTEKPDNKQLIEQVMSEVLGKPWKFKTVMRKDWQQAISKSETPQPQEVLLPQPEQEKAAKFQEEWINEAIELFGEDMVTIVEEE